MICFVLHGAAWCILDSTGEHTLQENSFFVNSICNQMFCNGKFSCKYYYCLLKDRLQSYVLTIVDRSKFVPTIEEKSS